MTPPAGKPPGSGRTPIGGYPVQRPSSSVGSPPPRGEFSDEDLTPVRMILDLTKKLDDHNAQDALALENVRTSISSLEGRFATKHEGLQMQQTALMTETTKQTVMLEGIRREWDRDQADRRSLAAAARKELDIRRQTRTKYILACIAVIGPILAIVVTYELSRQPPPAPSISSPAKP